MMYSCQHGFDNFCRDSSGGRTDLTTAPLSREAMIDHALDVADTDGLAAVSIRRIAQDFGVTPMALYWHVKNKDELLAAMGDGSSAVSNTHR